MKRHTSDLSSQKGFVLVYMAATLTTLLLFTGLAVDTGRAYVVKAQLTKAEDHAVSKYIADQKAKGITVTPQLPPGPPPSADGAKSLPAQPEKASNAHSPPQK